eukprot:8606296-Alexandrium_andersonii.AAC.1
MPKHSYRRWWRRYGMYSISIPPRLQARRGAATGPLAPECSRPAAATSEATCNGLSSAELR